MSDYIRWELSWGYQPGVAAGEEVCIIPVADGEWPVDVPHRDFWLFDDTELYDMHYTVDGTWLGAEPVTDPSRIEQARSWRDTALARAPVAAVHHGSPETGRAREYGPARVLIGRSW